MIVSSLNIQLYPPLFPLGDWHNDHPLETGLAEPGLLCFCMCSMSTRDPKLDPNQGTNQETNCF